MSEHHESNRAFYDRIASAYDLMSDHSERPARLAGLQALEVQPGENVLEVGFGTGNEIIDLAGLVGSGGIVAGIDISSGMLAVTEHKLAAMGITAPVDLRVGDARMLPWPDGLFDVVYSSFTLELFPEEDLPFVLSEMSRVLRPGGRIGIVSMATVNPGDRPSFLERTYIWMHRHFPHIVDCRPIDVPAVVRMGGFEVTGVLAME